MKNDALWDCDYIQFARLLAEIVAAGGDTDQLLEAIAVSMDLEVSEVDDIFERAQARWLHMNTMDTHTKLADAAWVKNGRVFGGSLNESY